jgi:hypothetical protein
MSESIARVLVFLKQGREDFSCLARHVDIADSARAEHKDRKELFVNEQTEQTEQPDVEGHVFEQTEQTEQLEQPDVEGHLFEQLEQTEQTEQTE